MEKTPGLPSTTFLTLSEPRTTSNAKSLQAPVATSGNTVSALGFDPAMLYLGDRIGVDRSQRERVAGRLATCGR